MNYVCGYLFLRFNDGCEFCQINPSQTLLVMNLQYRGPRDLLDHQFNQQGMFILKIYKWYH